MAARPLWRNNSTVNFSKGLPKSPFRSSPFSDSVCGVPGELQLPFPQGHASSKRMLFFFFLNASKKFPWIQGFDLGTESDDLNDFLMIGRLLFV